MAAQSGGAGETRHGSRSEAGDGAQSGARSLHDLEHLAGDVHCREVLEEVYLYLDGEMTDAERAAIKDHLDDCSPCLQRYGIEQEVKALIARTCGREMTPGHLRERVLTTLRQTTVATSVSADSVTTTVTQVEVTETRR